MSFPSPNLEVKIVLPIAFRGSGLNACARLVWVLRLKGQRDDHQGGQREERTNESKRVHDCLF